MKEMINPVAGIKHIALGDIQQLVSSPGGLAQIKFVKATDIPMVNAGVSFSFNKAEGNPGPVYTVNLTANLKSELPKLKRGILLISLESGEQLIIGERNLPVNDLSAPESLLSKQLQVSHKSWHKPYVIAL